MKELTIYSYNKNDLSLLPKRPKNSNKGSFGRLLCVCGSADISGAAYLCAKAAYRTGAGLVEILTHKNNRTALASLLPEALISVYSDTLDTQRIRETVKRADAVVIGCGIGTSVLAKKLLSTVLSYVSSKRIPCVADADALNIIASDSTLRVLLKSCIITPHPLEYSRLSSISDIDGIVASASQYAHALSSELECICVLKTHTTAVSDTSERVYVNACGNSGMATGGSGDVLAGIIGGILAQMKSTGADMTLAATLGVYIHSIAGDIAAEKLSEYSMIASDIIDALPCVFKNI